MSGRLSSLAIFSATIALAGCQFLFNQASGGSPPASSRIGTGESVEGRVRLAGADETPAATPLDATQPLDAKRPLTLGDDFGGIPAAAPIALTSAPALTQGSGLTLLEPYRLARRVTATEAAVFVEAVSLVSGELLGRVAADETGRFKIGLPAYSRFSPLVLQATTLQRDTITLFLAALLPPDPKGPKARTQDISPGSTATAFGLAKLGGVGEQLDVSTGFRGFRSGGVAALGMMAEPSDAIGAPAIDKGIGAGISQLTLLEPYRVASGQGAAKGIKAAFYAASTLAVKLAGAAHRQLSLLNAGQYRVASISLAETAAFAKLIQTKLGEPPAGAFNLGGFTTSSAADLVSWAQDAAGKVEASELATEASRKEALAQERLQAAKSEGAGEDLNSQLGGVLDTVKSATVAPPSPTATPAPTPIPTPTPTPTPTPIVALGTGVSQLAKLADGRIVTTTLAAGQLVALDLTSGAATDGPVLAAQLQTPTGVAVAQDGAILESDYTGHVVRRISGGAIAIVAGTGTATSSGDGGQAAAAGLDGPSSLALSASGDIYVAESLGNRIRVINPGGTISTFAGGGTRSFSSTTDGAEGADATTVSLAGAYQLALSPSGELHIVNNYSYGVVWKVDAQGKIRTVAGIYDKEGTPGENIPAAGAKLSSPKSITFDPTGNLYISCAEGIRRVGLTGLIKTVFTPSQGESVQAILVDGTTFYAAIKIGNAVQVRKLENIL